jgi:2,4-dienoyl-CoA reductase-like NADH-dependent reductase (Old Yellow Enzyme family)
VPFAARIKKETGILTGAVGLITEAAQAEDILQENKADMIIMARAFLRDPYFPMHAAKALGYDLGWPVQYRRAKR